MTATNRFQSLRRFTVHYVPYELPAGACRTPRSARHPGIPRFEATRVSRRAPQTRRRRSVGWRLINGFCRVKPALATPSTSPALRPVPCRRQPTKRYGIPRNGSGRPFPDGNLHVSTRFASAELTTHPLILWYPSISSCRLCPAPHLSA